MKTKLYILIFLLVQITISCNKKPSANFTTDKVEYIAGETVQFDNKSERGNDFVWTMPDGQTITTREAQYTIGSDMGFSTINFNLEAFSKHHKKNDSKSVSVEVIPHSFINLVGNTIICNHVIYQHDYQNNLIGFNVYNDNNVDAPTCYQEEFWVLFKGNQFPLPGTYSLVPYPYSVALQNNEAVITFSKGPCEMPYEVHSVSGQLIVDIVNGRLHITFTNVPTQDTTVFLSGEVFVPANA